jgi:hypothetical protein
MDSHLSTYQLLRQRLLVSSRSGLLAAILLLLVGFANQANATAGFYRDYVVINGLYFYTNNNDGTNRPFLSANLGSFDRANGRVILGAEANTYQDRGDDVGSVQMFYRVYRQGTQAGPFISLNLNYVRSGDDGNRNNKRWDNRTSNPNLVDASSGPGTYVLEVYFQLVAYYGNNSNFQAFDSNGGNNYTATFDVTGSIPLRWNGSVSDDWFTAANWTPNAVPDETTDISVPFIPGGNNPTVRNGIALVRTFRIMGDNGAIGARNFLQGGELRVYGNFQDPNGGFAQTGGLFTLAGQSQTFDGATFLELSIEGGGTKILTNRMDVLTSLTFRNGGGVISTRTDNTTAYNIDLGANASIYGESDFNYVLGVLRTVRLVTNTLNTFGGIGVELLADGVPGRTLVTRLTGYVYNGVPPSKSVKRSFTFTPDNPDNQNFTLNFHYLDTEVNGIDENNLVLFRSVNGGIPFQNLMRTSLNTSDDILVRTNIAGTLAATFTLGDRITPLPVALTTFDAVAQGSDALLTWNTAQEFNSQGYEVQVSLDGKSYQKVGFVASETPNSAVARSYQYRDVTPGKQGLRYYRLRQIDLDGKESYYGPNIVRFGDAVAGTVLSYPNPFNAEINLTLQASTAGAASIQLIDGVGRQVRTWQPALEAGASNLRLDGLDGLPHGIYVVQVRYSNGQTQRLKMVKQ